MDINTELRKKARKKGFIKYFFKLMNNAAFGGTIRNMKKHRNIKLVTTQARRNYLISEQNSHTTIFFSEILIAIEMKKTQILMNKLIYLGLSMLKISKIGKYQF